MIPPEFEDLFHGAALASIATLRRDGTPHLTPVWIDLEDGLVLVNARADRVKTANMQRRGDVAVLVVDPGNPNRYVSVTGVVESVSDAGSMPHMDRLSRRYLRVRKYPWAAPGERRLIFRIRPTRVLTDPGDGEMPEPEL
ncbi:MAG TPA: PPOX class F420-dependent oxidoreductase [Candidatus Dormibacteraeota bacterium]